MTPAETAGPRFALLADGSTIEVRQAAPGDAEAVRAMHAGMSPDNVYLRFFSFSRDSAEREARRVCRRPGPRHAALLAWRGGTVVGVASYEATAGEPAAEVAFAVADDMHGRGIATLLLEHLVSLARDGGITTFTAQTLSQNEAMLSVFHAAGLRTEHRTIDGVAELTMVIPRQPALNQESTYLDAVAGRERRADVASLVPLLAPRCVAVVGAGRSRGSLGRAIVTSIRSAGFTGGIYAVNAHGGEPGGEKPGGEKPGRIRFFRSVADLPEPPDLAVVVVPAAAVPGVAAECGKRGARALVVVTSGLDAGQHGSLLTTCRRHSMRLVGPSSFGVAVPGIGLDATFGAGHPGAGSAGVIVQSGGVGVALLEQLTRLGIGISSFVAAGDKLDVSSNDLLGWWEGDAATRIAVLHMESFGNPRKFARTARRVGRSIPVLTVHAGRSPAGERAAISRTAAAAPSAAPPSAPLATRQALFEQAGIIATASLGELVETAALLAVQPAPAGHRVAIVSNAGGPGVLAADACADAGLAVHMMTAPARSELARLLPPGADVAGPVDTMPSVTPGQFRRCLEITASDGGVSAVLAIAVSTALGDITRGIREAVLPVPLAAVLLDQPEAVRLLPAAGRAEAGAAGAGAGQQIPTGTGAGANPQIPAYAFPEGAARALGHAARYGAWRARPAGTVPVLDGVHPDAARLVTRSFLDRMAGGWLTTSEARDLLACYGVPTAGLQRAETADAAAAVAAELGGRVAVKAEVPGLVGKSDAGAVLLDLRGEGDVRSAFGELAARFGDRLRGVFVQQMISGGVELLVGVTRDPVFGPLVSLGEHAARLAPLTGADADDLVRSAAPRLLPGQHDDTTTGTAASAVRDTQPTLPDASHNALRDTLLRVSQLADDLPDVAGLDLDPVIVRRDGGYAVDARVRVSPQARPDPFLRRLR